jgi:D-alanine-D-alanine ligase
VKPSAHGSAIGVARLEGDAGTGEVARALEAVWAIDDFAIVEHFARGREVTCGVLDVGRAEALPPTEVVSPHDAFYTYEARYAPGRSVHACPADLPPEVTARVQEVAVLAHAALGCRDLSRVDFVVGDEGAPHRVTLLEVNTLPGMTAMSLYPEAAAARGIPMPQLCASLALYAHARGPTRRFEARPLPR